MPIGCSHLCSRRQGMTGDLPGMQSSGPEPRHPRRSTGQTVPLVALLRDVDDLPELRPGFFGAPPLNYLAVIVDVQDEIA